MKIATWNLNSVRQRQDRLLAWLQKEQPDVLCLQELKAQVSQFPLAEVQALGYHAAIHGQKTWNGVALLSREAPSDVTPGFGDEEEEDPQARLVAATYGSVRVISAYFPNGQHPGSDKWYYKLAWMERLRRYLERLDPARPVVLAGDFNVAPEERDIAFPDLWRNTVLTHTKVRDALEQVRAWGFTDAVRLHHEGPGPYSWWDYRNLGFPRGDGLRIDHIYCTAPLASRCTAAYVDRDERKGEKPSDHAPVVAVFDAAS